jgi:hypothetical protein
MLEATDLWCKQLLLPTDQIAEGLQAPPPPSSPGGGGGDVGIIFLLLFYLQRFPKISAVGSQNVGALGR